MTFTFYESLPANYRGTASIISGQGSLQFAGTEYLLVREADTVDAFEIKYEYHCNPFKQAAIVDNLLLVGHEGQFYLYDLTAQQHISTLNMRGYFGHFYIYQDHFYLADSSGLLCLNKNGHVLWRTSGLGIDGVIVQEFTDEKIFGSGECDPPGGWQDFILDLKTGKVIKENAA